MKYHLHWIDELGNEHSLTIPGRFALWRDDAGFASGDWTPDARVPAGQVLSEIDRGPCRALADDDGLTSVTFVNDGNE